MRTYVIPAQHATRLDMALDKLMAEVATSPEWGQDTCRPGEVLEIRITRSVPNVDRELFDAIKGAL